MALRPVQACLAAGDAHRDGLAARVLRVAVAIVAWSPWSGRGGERHERGGGERQCQRTAVLVHRVRVARILNLVHECRLRAARGVPSAPPPPRRAQEIIDFFFWRLDI